MKKKHSQFLLWRSSSAIVIATMAFPLVGCGSKGSSTTSSSSIPPPVPASAGQMAPKAGLSTKQKVVLLAGAAALYYYYNRSKKADQAKMGAQVQYYRSKNGGIYYRDPQTHQAHFVTAPSDGYQVQVPADEAQQYNGYQGYNNASSGKTLDDAFPAPTQ